MGGGPETVRRVREALLSQQVRVLQRVPETTVASVAAGEVIAEEEENRAHRDRPADGQEDREVDVDRHAEVGQAVLGEMLVESSVVVVNDFVVLDVSHVVEIGEAKVTFFFVLRRGLRRGMIAEGGELAFKSWRPDSLCCTSAHRGRRNRRFLRYVPSCV